MKKKLKTILQVSLLLVTVGIGFVAWANYSIRESSSHFISFHISDLPEAKTALLLGTSKNLSNGFPNAYFDNRIQATVDLFNSGKVQYVIVSGDNGRKDYNEPEDMLLALVQHGIPQDRIYMDHAGFRTLDSVLRAKDIFGQKKMIIISQKFHNERAVFLARQNGIDAFGFNAKDVNKYAGFKTNIREYIAKAKAYYDLLLGIEPKYGGEKILIP